MHGSMSEAPLSLACAANPPVLCVQKGRINAPDKKLRGSAAELPLQIRQVVDLCDGEGYSQDACFSGCIYFS